MAKRKEDPAIEPTLPITPMLDMTFQLFAFFVFTYSPQSLEGKLDFSLPASGDYKSQKAEDVNPTSSDTEVELPAEVTVEVRTVREGPTTGNISQILVKTAAGDIPVSNLEELASKLREMRPNLVNQTDIKIQGESKLKWAVLIEVMDTCMNKDKGGFENVGFAPPPDLDAN